MQDAAAELAKKIEQNKETDRRIPGESDALDRCYGRIGISAVAAAARYQGSAKNPAYAPSSNTWRDRIAAAVA